MVQDVVPAVGVELKEVFHDADLNFAARRGGILVQRGVHLPQAQDRERHSASKKKKRAQKTAPLFCAFTDHTNNPFRTTPTFVGTYYLQLVWGHFCSTKKYWIRLSLLAQPMFGSRLY